MTKKQKTSPDQQEALNAIMQLQSLDGFPTKPRGQNELVIALTAFCKTPEHITDTVAYFAEMGRKCPTAYDIQDYAYKAGWAAPAEPAESKMPLKDVRARYASNPCEFCDNDGRVVKEGWVRDPLRPGRPAMPADPEHNLPAIPAEPPKKRWASWVEYCHCPVGIVKKRVDEKAAARSE